MLRTIVLLILLPLVYCSGDGNIGILKDEITNVLRACSTSNGLHTHRRRRFNDGHTSRIDDIKELNPYSHEKRDTNDTKHINHVSNVSELNYGGRISGSTEETKPNIIADTNLNSTFNMKLNRTRRNEPLMNKGDSDKCLSQCVFANLQVVDSRGIPREAELKNKIQSSVRSQQTQSALRDQVRACFQELQSEAEDDGCSYSNKLERCLMLRFSDRNITSARRT